MAMKLLMITQWFDPEPTFKGLYFARELQKLGFDVEVVTGFPNYPGGRVYPGYRIRWIQRDVIDGVRVTRVPLYPSHDGSLVGRVLNYLSFAVTAALYGLIFASRPHAIYAYHPPLTVGLAAAMVSAVRRAPLVLDIQDLWPDSLRATGMIHSPSALSFIAALCRLVYSIVDRIVVQSPGFRKLLLERGVPAAKIEIIYNWADEAAISVLRDDPVRAVLAQSDVFVVLFAGNIGAAQALESVVEAAAVLKQMGERVEFHFLGSGVRLDALKDFVVRRKVDNVHFIPRVPMSGVAGHLLSADALLVHLRRDRLFRSTIPSKTQAYLAAGRPIIMAVDGDAADLITQSGGGVVAKSEDPASIVDAVRKLLRMTNRERRAIGDAGQCFYRRELAATAGIAKFEKLLRTMIERFERRMEG